MLLLVFYVFIFVVKLASFGLPESRRLGHTRFTLTSSPLFLSAARGIHPSIQSVKRPTESQPKTNTSGSRFHLAVPLPPPRPDPPTCDTPLSINPKAVDLLVGLVHNLLNLLELHVALLGRSQQQQQQQQQAGQGGAEGGGGGGGHHSSSPSPLLSPYLGGALLWCLTRWAGAYLFPDLSLYEVSGSK